MLKIRTKLNNYFTKRCIRKFCMARNEIRWFETETKKLGSSQAYFKKRGKDSADNFINFIEFLFLIIVFITIIISYVL